MRPTDARPLPVTILAALVLLLTAQSAVRFGAALWNWPTLAMYAPQPGPLYIALTGLFWMAAGSLTLYGLLFPMRRAHTTALAFCLTYPLYIWLDRLFIQADPLRPNLPFALLATAVWLVFSTLTLIGAKPYFLRGTHEQKIQT